ncbi:galectin-1-like [Aquarana catesbeiana]|uniref:galectin-1-like n=1 Tax=Aquarana catesbeiana TaxID=8400 RepID=UPI003CCA6C60
MGGTRKEVFSIYVALVYLILVTEYNLAIRKYLNNYNWNLCLLLSEAERHYLSPRDISVLMRRKHDPPPIPGDFPASRPDLTEDKDRFAINLGTDEKNYVLHFNPRFDYSQDKKIIILNSMVDDVFGEEQRESCFPFQEGSDTTQSDPVPSLFLQVCFQFEQDKIVIELPTGNPLSFPVRFPIEEISYLSLRNLQLKSITLK